MGLGAAPQRRLEQPADLQGLLVSGIELEGTFPLPESQLDRFLMRLELGYPNEENERDLITGDDRRAMLADIETFVS